MESSGKKYCYKNISSTHHSSIWPRSVIIDIHSMFMTHRQQEISVVCMSTVSINIHVIQVTEYLEVNWTAVCSRNSSPTHVMSRKHTERSVCGVLP